MKICKDCKKEKSGIEFSKHIKTYDGLNVRCKMCQRDYQILCNYGINFTKEKEKQNNRCACCEDTLSNGTEDRQYEGYVDHDHKTGKYRGIVCHYCNSMLGHAKDDIEVLKKAIKYFNTTRNQTQDIGKVSELHKRIMSSLLRQRSGYK